MSDLASITPPFRLPDTVPELSLSKEVLREFIRSIIPNADIVIEGNRVYVKIPLDVWFEYRVDGDRVVLVFKR